MKIQVANVGAIKKGEIEIAEGMFNIKYAMNGTGKSSIATFLQADLSSDLETKKRFVPFGTTDVPSISFAPQRPSTCMVFNEQYIKQYLFKKDDLLNNTLHLLKMTPAVSAAISNYDAAVADLKAAAQAPALDEFVKKAEEIGKTFKVSQSGLLAANSKMGKASKLGCNTLHPNGPETMVFKDNIELPEAPLWYQWWETGNQYVHSVCPFCGQTLPTDFQNRKNQLMALFQSVDSKNNVAIRQALLGVAADMANHSGVDAFLATTNSPSPTEVRDVVNDLNAYIDLAKKITDARNLDPLDLGKQNPASLNSGLNSMKINLTDIGNTNLKNACGVFNQKVDALISNGMALFALIIQCKTEISAAVKRFKDYMNEYLRRCGIPYQFEIRQTGLDHAETALVKASSPIPSESLSYGERNCLCFALFVLDVCQSNPDLIILDDPISSFDSGKRFSMFFSAFNKGAFTLKNRTVVLLTHDMTPLVDFVKRESAGVGNLAKGWKVTNVDGVLVEKEISATDIDSTMNIEKTLASDISKPLVSRLVHARRFLEISGIYGPAYDIISCLFHGKGTPDHKDGPVLSATEIQEGLDVLGTMSITGDYGTLFVQLGDSCLTAAYKTTKDKYEKMAIARILLGRLDIPTGKPFHHFLDAIFHIEQESLFSCSLFAEDSIPQYVIDYVESDLKNKIPALK